MNAKKSLHNIFMNMRILFCIILLIKFLSVQSQNFNWAASVTSGGTEYGIKSVKDASGNTYLIGTTSLSNFKYQGIIYSTNGFGDTFFAKLDPNKSLIWMKSIGTSDSSSDEAEDIHIDSFGDIYISITSDGHNFTYNGQILSGISAVGFNYTGEAVLLKVNSNGDYIWHDSGEVDSKFYGITSDSEGNVYVTGTFCSSITLGGSITLTNPSTYYTDNLLIAKYQPNGTIVWAKYAGGLINNIFAVGIDVNVNPQTEEVIVLCKASDGVSFDGIPMPPSTLFGSNDGFVLISYNSNGTQNWIKRILDGQLNTFSVCRSMDISNTGIIGICGFALYSGLVGFYTSDGTVITEHNHPTIDGLRFNSIAFNEFNDAYIAGWCEDGILGMSPGTVSITNVTGFIVKMDIYQQVKWLKKFYSSYFKNQIHYSNGKLSYASRIDSFFYYNSGQTVIYNYGGDALFGEVTDNEIPLGVTAFNPNNINVYPNPTKGLINIDADDFEQIDIYNFNGVLVLSSKLKQINFIGHPSGIYLLKIRTKTGSINKKMIVN